MPYNYPRENENFQIFCARVQSQTRPMGTVKTMQALLSNDVSLWADLPAMIALKNNVGIQPLQLKAVIKDRFCLVTNKFGWQVFKCLTRYFLMYSLAYSSSLQSRYTFSVMPVYPPFSLSVGTQSKCQTNEGPQELYLEEEKYTKK